MIFSATLSAEDLLEREERIMLVKTTQNFLLDEGLIAYNKSDLWYVHLLDFFEISGLAIKFSVEDKRAEGFVIKEERSFRLDFKTCELDFQGQKKKFDCEMYFEEYDGLYVDTRLLEKFLPMKIIADSLSSEFRLETYEDLPPVAAQKRSQRVQRRNESEDDGFVTYEIPRGWLDGFNLDQDIVHQQQKNPNSGQTESITSYQSILSAEILKHELYTSYSGQNGKTQDTWLSLERNDHNARIFGDVGLTQMKFHHFTSPSLTLIGGARKITGAMFTNRPYTFATQFTKQDFVGPLETGWEVELYQNQIFIGRDVGDQNNQRYEFLGVDLYYGTNLFHFIFYGPRGEIRHQYQTLNIDQIFQETERPIISAAYGSDENGDRYRYLEVDQLIMKRLFAEAYTTTFTNREGEEKNYYGVGLNTFFLGAILKTHMATDEQGHALQSDLRFTFLRKYNLNFNYLKADQFQSEQVGPNKMITESYGGQVLMPLSFLPGIQLFSEFSSQTFVDSTNNFLQRYRLGYNYHRFFFFNNIEFNNSLFKNELAARLNIGRTQWRAAHISDKDGPLTTSLNLNIRRRDYHHFILNYDYGHHSALNSYSIRYDRHFKSFTLGTTARYDSNDVASIALNLSFGLAFDYDTGAHFSHKRNADHGNLKIVSYTDLNDNDRFDEDEPVVSDILYRRISDREEKVADKDGEVFFTHLQTNRSTSFRPSAFQTKSIYLNPKYEGMKVWARRGKTGVVHFPMVYQGDVEGDVDFGNYAELRRKMKGKLIKASDGSVRTFFIERDGYFLLQNINVGDYQLEISCDSCGLEPIYETIKMPQEGDSIYVEGLKFVGSE